MGFPQRKKHRRKRPSNDLSSLLWFPVPRAGSLDASSLGAGKTLVAISGFGWEYFVGNGVVFRSQKNHKKSDLRPAKSMSIIEHHPFRNGFSEMCCQLVFGHDELG